MTASMVLDVAGVAFGLVLFYAACCWARFEKGRQEFGARIQAFRSERRLGDAEQLARIRGDLFVVGLFTQADIDAYREIERRFKNAGFSRRVSERPTLEVVR